MSHVPDVVRVEWTPWELLLAKLIHGKVPERYLPSLVHPLVYQYSVFSKKSLCDQFENLRKCQAVGVFCPQKICYVLVLTWIGHPNIYIATIYKQEGENILTGREMLECKIFDTGLTVGKHSKILKTSDPQLMFQTQGLDDNIDFTGIRGRVEKKLWGLVPVLDGKSSLFTTWVIGCFKPEEGCKSMVKQWGISPSAKEVYFRELMLDRYDKMQKFD